MEIIRSRGDHEGKKPDIIICATGTPEMMRKILELTRWAKKHENAEYRIIFQEEEPVKKRLEVKTDAVALQEQRERANRKRLERILSANFTED